MTAKGVGWRGGSSVLLVVKTGENHRLVASHWQTLSHNIHIAMSWIRTTTLVVICTDCICTGSFNPTTIRSRPPTPPPICILKFTFAMSCNIDIVCQWLARSRWFSPVFTTNKTDDSDINEILLKVLLNLTPQYIYIYNKAYQCQNTDYWMNK
jgi:hypothetical protein